MEKELLNKNDLDRIISRIAYEIIERNRGCENLYLTGIYKGGVPIAKRLANKIKTIEDVFVPIANLDIALYRDDLNIRKNHPLVRKTDIPFDITDKKIVLVEKSKGLI
ncbi:bifunctional pyrimidine regulatory protein PyrR/uracil phosphoribosyltransferase [Candidatus Magnetoovum chiemensis]|nr:bifunctional pyrimidine regulatory protein PyrR/uracil phosphoribosyltransferase [Candidatus Magnetoovum chiemensis]